MWIIIAFVLGFICGAMAVTLAIHYASESFSQRLRENEAKEINPNHRRLSEE